MRQGADHIKIMMSGGVASPYDPLDSLQFSPGRGRRRRAGGARLRPLRLRARLHAGSDDARRARRRARDRARQPDRRRDRQADGREGHVHGGQPGRLLRDARARRRIRHDRRHAGEERSGHRRRPALAGDLQARRRPGRLRHRSARRAAGRAEPRIHDPQRGAVADRDHPRRPRRSARGSCGRKASSAR